MMDLLSNLTGTIPLFKGRPENEENDKEETASGILEFIRATFQCLQSLPAADDAFRPEGRRLARCCLDFLDGLCWLSPQAEIARSAFTRCITFLLIPIIYVSLAKLAEEQVFLHVATDRSRPRWFFLRAAHILTLLASRLLIALIAEKSLFNLLHRPIRWGYPL